MIEVENLVKKYGSHIAVNQLTFQVKKGQIYGFLGPNGAGKSTTMNIMTGYLAATEGKVRINGYDMLTQSEKAKKSIGYLPEVPPLYQEMMVDEYLGFAAELKKIPKKERKQQIAEVLELTKTEEVSKRLIHNLSKGYKQRVGIAQAILGYPEVIILDEPTVGLDPKQIIEIRDLIRYLAGKHTVILSSHILSEVSAVCDQIMIMSKGKLVASDSPKGLQETMGSKAELKLSVLAVQEETEKVLQTISSQKEVHLSYTQEADVLNILIRFSTESGRGDEISREVGRLLAQNQIPVISMCREEKSLEDIYLSLMSCDSDTNASAREQQAVQPQLSDQEQKENDDESHS